MARCGHVPSGQLVCVLKLKASILRMSLVCSWRNIVEMTDLESRSTEPSSWYCGTWKVSCDPKEHQLASSPQNAALTFRHLSIQRGWSHWARKSVSQFDSPQFPQLASRGQSRSSIRALSSARCPCSPASITRRSVRETMDLSPPTGQSLPSASSGRAPSSARGPLAGGRQITRNRASYSCYACRRRKVKCDKVFRPRTSNSGALCN